MRLRKNRGKGRRILTEVVSKVGVTSVGVGAGADHASEAAVIGKSVWAIPQANFFFDLMRYCT
jgi:hypothetical protein